jgi:hypothetical protein
MLGEASGEAAENTSTIDLSTFEKTLSIKDLATELRVSDVIHFPWFLPIDTISPTHTVGKGRTNLTLIAPDIMQTDTTGTPYASFSNRQTSSGGPGVSVHFQPSGYGITNAANYIVSFDVVLHALPPTQITYVSIQQTAGAAWSWYSTSFEHPPLVITIGDQLTE